MPDYLKVEGRENLVRDKKSKAIINTDTDARKKALDNRLKRLKTEKRLEALEDKVDQILELLQKK